MDFATLAPVRFGFGLSPRAAGPLTVPEMLAALRSDGAGAQFPGMQTDVALKMRVDFVRLKRAERDDEPGAAAALKAHKAALHDALVDSLQLALARAVDDPAGMRERLFAFWRDHFTIQGKRREDYALAASHAEALRPHLTGSFPAMLRAAVLHPMMLIYLDQTSSFGPGSRAARKKPERGLGLNENLAREVIELHTLGVGGAYTQDDVRQLAELFTGLRVLGEAGTQFSPDLAEPGAEQVLGRSFGGDPARLDDIHAVLDALALHPDTARHLARKLAVHFVGPDPAPDLTAAMAEAYLGANGALMPVYQVLLEHPGARGDDLLKVRQPFEFIATSLRALGLSGAEVMGLSGAILRKQGYWPLRSMGQQWLAPRGPDGWPEAAEDWIAPQTLSARINWALKAPAAIAKELSRPLPDARDFLPQALGPRVTEALSFAVPRAESRAEGIALVLASPEFNRR